MHCPLSDSAPHSDLLNLGLGCSPMSCLGAEWELLYMSVVRSVKMPWLLATLERKPSTSCRQSYDNSFGQSENHMSKAQGCRQIATSSPSLLLLLTGNLKAHL